MLDGLAFTLSDKYPELQIIPCLGMTGRIEPVAARMCRCCDAFRRLISGVQIVTDLFVNFAMKNGYH